MITNPQLGMRVRIIEHGSSMSDRTGSITHIYGGESNAVVIRLDNHISHMMDWFITIDLLVLISPEEQTQYDDQQRRLAHAMQYL